MIPRSVLCVCFSLAFGLPVIGQDAPAAPAAASAPRPRPAPVRLDRDYPVTPVPFTSVRIADSFWTPRLETNRKVSIPYAFQQCEETGRVANFLIAAGLQEGKFLPPRWNDTDIYKGIEAASYSLALHPDPALDEYMDGLIAKVAAAQEDDGYLYTARTCNPDNPPEGCGPERWSSLSGSHELYNAGHLYESATAHYLVTGKRSLLDVAINSADLVDRVFGPEAKIDVPGHEVIEMGLAKLYRVTGEKRYLDLARFFIDMRGRSDLRKTWGEYNQDHKPVVEQDEAVGHAVRATYLYAGVADVAALSGDARYVAAVDRIWQNVAAKKLYLTGGVGANPSGEAFGPNYVLPNATAYNETCAAVGNAMWNHRMFLLHGDAKYLDVLERTVYNGLISGVSLDGDKFFYPNPLASKGNYSRQPWFGCACCPQNLMRFLASLSGYCYAEQGDTLFVGLFVGGEAEVTLPAARVRITQQTRYPWDGAVRILVAPEHSAEFTLAIRIPGWARGRPVPSDLYRYLDSAGEPVSLKVNGEQVPIDLENGFARVRRTWKAGDVVDLNLPMPIRRVVAHEAVEADRGRVALERGPIVYCAEGVDNAEHVANLILPDDSPLEARFRDDLLGGVVAITGKAAALQRVDPGRVEQQPHEFTAIPYSTWANRGANEMAVWLARESSAAEPLPAPTIASTSRASVSFMREGGEPQLAVAGLNDQVDPRSSNDQSIARFHWWPHQGTAEWVQYDFQKPARVFRVEVYWFDDTGQGNCRVPQSWKLLGRIDGQWKEVPQPSAYGTEPDKFNVTTFTPVEATGLRIEAQLRPGYSSGILEWRVE
jgi:DUF1680 family protein